MCARQRSWRNLRDWARGEIGGVVGVESEWADDGVSLCGIHKYGDGREVGVGGWGPDHKEGVGGWEDDDDGDGVMGGSGEGSLKLLLAS